MKSYKKTGDPIMKKMKDSCTICTHLLQVYRQSDKKEWYECELRNEWVVQEIADPDNTCCKLFKEYRRNSCFDCWYYIMEYSDDGKYEYAYCHLTDEKLPSMIKNCENYRRNN